jgi:hypothetical protein
MRRWLVTCGVVFMAALVSAAPGSSTGTQVLHTDGGAVAAVFEFELNGTPATLRVGAYRNTTRDAPSQTSVTTTAVEVELSQFISETGETTFYVYCQIPLANETLSLDGLSSASLVATLACTDVLNAEPFELTLNLFWQSSGAPTPGTQGGAVLATASGTVAFNGQTYALASSPGTAVISRYQWSDPVRTVFQRIWQTGGGPVWDPEQLSCVGASADSSLVWTLTGTAVYAIDATGTYHLHVSLALDATIETTAGRYSGSGSLRFASALVPSFDATGTAVIPLSIPVTVKTEDQSPTADLIFDLSFFIFEGQQYVHERVDGVRCA